MARTVAPRTQKMRRTVREYSSRAGGSSSNGRRSGSRGTKFGAGLAGSSFPTRELRSNFQSMHIFAAAFGYARGRDSRADEVYVPISLSRERSTRSEQRPRRLTAWHRRRGARGRVGSRQAAGIWASDKRRSVELARAGYIEVTDEQGQHCRVARRLCCRDVVDCHLAR
jgi:hypothetical protein